MAVGFFFCCFVPHFRRAFRLCLLAVPTRIVLFFLGFFFFLGLFQDKASADSGDCRSLTAGYRCIIQKKNSRFSFSLALQTQQQQQQQQQQEKKGEKKKQNKNPPPPPPGMEKGRLISRGPCFSFVSTFIISLPLYQCPFFFSLSFWDFYHSRPR